MIVQTKNAGLRDWLAIAGGMVGCFMAILDIQITNSSLAPIEGSMGASVDEGSWIATAYLVAEIIVIPLTGWFSRAWSGCATVIWRSIPPCSCCSRSAARNRPA